MSMHSHVLGIDIGSVAVAAIQIAPTGNLVHFEYGFHHGRADTVLEEIISRFDLSPTVKIAATLSTPSFVKAQHRYDDQVAVLTAARHYYPQARSILSIGAEKFGLIQLDANGDYLTYRTNTGCAAGTGSFLDQQALRLKLKDVSVLSELALNNSGAAPKIASRCAVFAKTDLIHAQQEGYQLGEICDGLCRGLAKNVVDVLFSGQAPLGPLLFVGGVADNRAVAGHIERLIGLELLIPHFPFAAAGAALCCLQEAVAASPQPFATVADLVRHEHVRKTYHHAPIGLTLSPYPDFASRQSYLDDHWDAANPVEVDVYRDLTAPAHQKVYLGIDIGSTSSKAMFISSQGRPLAGLYTRTAGRPVQAVQNLMAAMDRLMAGEGVAPSIKGVATTGSGRKFAGSIIGADLVLDEITAHAKAAVALEPDVDTIIEIGGQDSKFTTLLNGRVTFSAMNAVCAAGTGSFIEEQAQRLGCPLEAIAGRTECQRSPLASDRCTVFMERDVNHYLSKGYTVGEVLAAVLHSVVENYLNKVAIETGIGTTIVFQGATARNKGLVAALEQRLEKPIRVSRYCHLTGAMGAALALAARGVDRSRFKGLALYRQEITIRAEVCELCANHCKITVADVAGETVAFGFLCGRDYQARKRVRRTTKTFDLLTEFQKAGPSRRPGGHSRGTTVGIPAALHLVEDLPMWSHFFEALGIDTITSRPHGDAVKEGKLLAGAEFCAPMTALYGHVRFLADACDHIFLPFLSGEKTVPPGYAAPVLLLYPIRSGPGGQSADAVSRHTGGDAPG